MDTQTTPNEHAILDELTQQIQTVAKSIVQTIEKQSTLSPETTRHFLGDIIAIESSITELLPGPRSGNERLLFLYQHLFCEIASAAFNINAFQKAEYYYHQSIETMRKMSFLSDTDRRRLAKRYINLCDCYFHLGHPHKARDMVYAAINEHNHITEKTNAEKNIAAGDQSSNDFLNKFRDFYEEITSFPSYINSPHFQVNNMLLKKMHDPEAMLCGSISSMQMDASIKNTTTTKEITAIEYLEAALQYPAIIKELSKHHQTDNTVKEKMMVAFADGIHLLEKIRYATLSQHDKKQFTQLFITLHAGLGDLCFRTGHGTSDTSSTTDPTSKASWEQVVSKYLYKYDGTHFPSCDFFLPSPFTLPSIHYGKYELESILINARRYSITRHSLNDYYWAVHQGLQAAALLKEQHGIVADTSQWLHHIGIQYFNNLQYTDAILLLQEAIKVKSEAHVEPNDDDHRWILKRYIDLFDCHVRRYNAHEMQRAYECAAHHFIAIKEKTDEELTLFKDSIPTINNIKPREFVNHFEQAKSNFLSSPSYQLSLNALEKIQSKEDVNAIITQMANYGLEKNIDSPATIMSDQDLREHANIYWLMYQEKMHAGQNNKTERQQKITALETALTTMEQINIPHSVDQSFIATVNRALHDAYHAAGRYKEAAIIEEKWHAIQSPVSSAAVAQTTTWLQPATFIPPGTGSPYIAQNLFAPPPISIPPISTPPASINHSAPSDDTDMECDDSAAGYSSF